MNLVGRLQAERHIATLRSHPNPGDPRRIEARARLLGSGSAAVEPLLEALKSTELRAAAMEILDGLLGDATLPSFMKALGSRDGAVAAAVADLLATGQGYDPTPLLDLFADTSVPKSRLEAVLSAQMKRIQPRLFIEMIPEMSREARAVTFRLLDRHADAAAVLDSVRLVDDPDWWIRLQMARLLARVAHPAGADALVTLLADDNPGVRLEAARSLAELRDGRTIPALCAALRDADLRVQTSAIDALIAIDDVTAVPHLVGMLRDPSESARRGAVEVLNAVGAEAAVEELVAAQEDPDWWVRARAADALARIGDPRARRESAREAWPATDRTPMSTPAPESGPSSSAVLPASGGFAGAPRPLFRDVAALASGDLLADRYRVERKVGGGGFGTVYLAFDRLIGEELILKILAPHLTHERSMLDRFIQELRVTRRLAHPAVIRTYELVDLGGVHAIAMEYFPSRDLAAILREEGPLSPERGVRLALQVCEALAAAHEQGTIHRDVKPGNILVDASDSVKVVDFGLATVGLEAGARHTRTGLLMGTPEYMAPEQITDGKVDARSDIYSLGVVLYEAFSGISPFAGENPAQVLFHHIEAEVSPLADTAPGIPAPLSALVMAAMARHPDDRPASAHLMAQQLRRLSMGAPAREEAA